jgi:hypothetical protein
MKMQKIGGLLTVWRFASLVCSERTWDDVCSVTAQAEMIQDDLVGWQPIFEVTVTLKKADAYERRRPASSDLQTKPDHSYRALGNGNCRRQSM